MTERLRIDLNADVGEGFDDEPLFSFVSSVNVACGGHAGDDRTMRSTAERAAASGCAVGAHPSFPDRAEFGRTVTTRDPSEIHTFVLEQTDRLRSVARTAGVALTHVKPHGALYNLSAIDPSVADAIGQAVRRLDPALRLVGLAHSHSIACAKKLGLRALEEAFVDRAYCENGTLVPRSEAGALVHDPDHARDRAITIARGQPLPTLDGGIVHLQAQTLCLHGDTPGAVDIAREVSRGLRAAGLHIAPPS